MKFSNVLLFASMALAAPTSQEKRQASIEKRQGATVVGTILNAVNTLSTTTETNLNQINNIVASIKDNVGGTVTAQVTAQLRANINAIAVALQDAAVVISTATTAALVGVGGQVQALTEQEVQDITTAAQEAIRIVGEISATLTIIASDLRPAVNLLLVTEINAVKAAISPFVLPILVFINAVRTSSASASVTVTGLTSLLQNLIPVFTRLLTTLGLPLLGLPRV
ncbi:hypothetical protein QQZ08_002543 [Neonectria magnoliae]|uniref:Uncharacterized protein n=1 Tax=Neonectria magnoliae TaxID=2732573 RepID=A0ABR1IDS8_9HYPO